MGFVIHGYHKRIFHISQGISSRLRSRRIPALARAAGRIPRSIDRDPEVRWVLDYRELDLEVEGEQYCL